MSARPPSACRRAFVLGAAAFAAAARPVAAGAVPSPAAKPMAAGRRLRFFDLHTHESLDVVYAERGRYLPDALAAVNRQLRDFRTGDVHPIDPKLLDLLHALQGRLETRGPFQVISGYRSKATNAMLAARSGGVAKHSLHMDGMAIDIRLPDRTLAELHRAALGLRRGGVGLYTRSDFVHLDTGRVRRWGA